MQKRKSEHGEAWPFSNSALGASGRCCHPVLYNQINPAPPRPTQFQNIPEKKGKKTAASRTVGEHVEICSNNPDSQSCSSSAGIITNCRDCWWVGTNSSWWCRLSAYNRVCHWLRESVWVWSQEHKISTGIVHIWLNKKDLGAEMIWLYTAFVHYNIWNVVERERERDLCCWSGWLRLRWRHSNINQHQANPRVVCILIQVCSTSARRWQ